MDKTRRGGRALGEEGDLVFTILIQEIANLLANIFEGWSLVPVLQYKKKHK